MYILKLKTKEAYTMKVLTELLQNCLKEGCFTFDQNGITLSGIDKKSKCGTELVNLQLEKDKFVIFKCKFDKLHVGINLLHLYKMLKSIKKKDTLMLYIDDQKPLDLGIKIQQSGDNSSSTSYIKITTLNPMEIEMPTGYGMPIITTSKEFQKLKTLNKISKTLKITSSEKKIRFFCNKENIFSRDIIIGEDDDKEENTEEETLNEEYTQTFDTTQIIKLVKMASLSSIVQIYIKKDLPLKVGLNIGSLGYISIHIKSKESLDEEQESNDFEQP